MSTNSAATTDQRTPPDNWYVRVGNKTIYGPVLLSVMKEWAAEGRIGRGNEVSSDKETWIPAENLPELQMQWFAHLKSGDEYGPFNILAAPHMVRRGIIGLDAMLENRTTGTTVPVQTLIKPGKETAQASQSDTVQQSAPPLKTVESSVAIERGAWYLKVRDGMVYGPVRMEKLKEWTQAGRIGPGNQVSKDRQNWMPADSIAELKMDWIARSADGKEYGPFSLLALHNLVRDGVIAPDSILCERRSGKQMSIQSLGNVSGWLRQAEHEKRPSLAVATPEAGQAETVAMETDLRKLRERLAALEKQVPALLSELNDANSALEEKQRDCSALRIAAERQRADFLGQIEELEKLCGLLKETEAVRERERTETDAALRKRLGELEHAAVAADDRLAAFHAEAEKAKNLADGELAGVRQELAEKARELAALQDASGKQSSELAAKASELERVSMNLRGELDAARQAVAQEKSLRETLASEKEEVEAALRSRVGALEQAAVAADDRLAAFQAEAEKAKNLAAGELAGVRQELAEKACELAALQDASGKQSSELAAKASELERVSVNLRGELDAARQAVVEEKSMRQAGEAEKKRLESALRQRDRELEQAAASAEKNLAAVREEAEQQKSAGERELLTRRGTGPDELPWHLKLDDGSTFGPVTVSDLCEWAAQCRIGPDHMISRDKKMWTRAQDVPELQMDWMVHFADGSSFGPLNFSAMRYLIEQGAATPDAEVSSRRTGVRSHLCDVIAADS